MKNLSPVRLNFTPNIIIEEDETVLSSHRAPLLKEYLNSETIKGK